MTHGDVTGVACPSCDKLIKCPLDLDVPAKGSVIEKIIVCQKCKVPVHLWARWEITVDAECESRVL